MREGSGSRDPDSALALPRQLARYAWPVFLIGWLLWRVARPLSRFIKAPNEQAAPDEGTP